MNKISMKIHSGDVSMDFDGKKILKGAFANMVLLTNDFNNNINEDISTVDYWLNDFVYRLEHVKDQFGDTHNLIVALNNGKLFEYFPLILWLSESQTIGRIVLALRFIQLFGNDNTAVINENNRELIVGELVKLTQHDSVMIALQAKAAVDILNGNKNEIVIDKKHCIDRADPLAVLDLQRGSDYLKLNNILIKKGCVAGLFCLINESKDIDGSSRDYQQILDDSVPIIQELAKVGFFDFFSSQQEWGVAAKHYPIMKEIFLYYTDQIKPS